LLDGSLIAQGRRLKDLNLIELMAYTYYMIIETNARGFVSVAEVKEHLDKMLYGVVVEDEDILPPSLKGKPVPHWMKEL